MKLANIAIGVLVVAALVLFAIGVIGLLSTGVVGVGNDRAVMFGVAGMFASVLIGFAGLIRAATVN